MTSEQWILGAIVLCLAGAVATLLISSRKTAAGWLAFAVTAASAGMVVSAVVHGLAAPATQTAEFRILPQIGFILRFHVDGLSAVFLLLAAVIAVPAALYSIDYIRSYEGCGVARYYPHFLLFLAAMYGLLSTTDMMWFFFIFWQMMTWPGYALIRFENRNPANIRAANKYLLMMQLACAVTMVGAELVAVSGASASGAALVHDFDAVSANLPALLAAKPGAATLAFALFLVGFGIKMGMWPFGQVWLPDAHPAAPSPVSALLSGVMIKTGVYGLMRYFLWLVPEAGRAHFPLGTWGCVVACLGVVTLFTGTLQALNQEQSKRLLAFHSIGQVGYILLGCGACMSLLAVGTPATAALAAVGFFGALLHVLNHGLFKGLLFLNAGSMLHATGTQDLSQMGGLMRYMPLTALTALVASASISGVPLFNGFVSKWAICVAAVLGGAAAKYLPVCALFALLTSALTLASFVKFFGVSFLSRASDLVTARARSAGRLEAGWAMQIPQVFLAALCLLLGLAPALGFRLLAAALAASRAGYGAALAEAPPVRAGVWLGLEAAQGAAVFAPLALLALLGLLFALVYSLARLGSAPRRAAPPWLCGYVREADCHRYSAHHFYGEFKRYFRWLGSPGAVQLRQREKTK